MVIDFVVVHTAAANRAGVTIDDIRAWHIERGFSDIGYHFVIDDNGAIFYGRNLYTSGAHSKGLNSKSIGICVTGHGDYYDFNSNQYHTLLSLLSSICTIYNLDAGKIIGHREIHLVSNVSNPNKSCPGDLVSMDSIRAMVKNKLLSKVKGVSSEG